MAQAAGYKCFLSTPEAWLMSAPSQVAACISRPRLAGWNMAHCTCFEFLFLYRSTPQKRPQCISTDSMKPSAQFPVPTFCKSQADIRWHQAMSIEDRAIVQERWSSWNPVGLWDSGRIQAHGPYTKLVMVFLLKAWCSHISLCTERGESQLSELCPGCETYFFQFCTE